MQNRERLVFVSDVHSNLEALEAVLEDAGEKRIFCLGDAVGYGGSPNEVVGLLRERRATMVIGNHDQAALTGDVGGFNARAAVAAAWTSNKLTDDNRRYLLKLPRELRMGMGDVEFYLTHGSPDDNLWEYVLPGSHSDLFGYYLKRLHAGAIGLGHTHIPYVWSGKEGTVFNPGSVGQPRDGDPRASYALVGVEGSVVEIEHRRIAYDVDASARKILEAGLPSSLARRLSAGE